MKMFLFFSTSVPARPDFDSLQLSNHSSLEVWQQLPYRNGVCERFECFQIGFIGSCVCYKNGLDTGMKVQIFHPDSRTLTTMAYCNFALY